MPDTPSPALSPEPLIIETDDAIFLDKGNGTRVRYYVLPEYEVHANVIAAGTVQGWHHHLLITEALFIVRGQLEARWIGSDGERTTRLLSPGTLFDVGTSVHTFANMSDHDAEFLVFRFIPEGVNKHELIKTDRYPDDIREA